MDMRASLRQAWTAFFTLCKERAEPLWARVLIAAALAVGVTFSLVMLAGLLRLSWFDPLWWRLVALPLVGVGATAGLSLLGLFRALELGVAEATLERLRSATSWRAGLALNALAAAGILIGCALGMGLVGALYDPAVWRWLAQPRKQVHLALFMLVLVGANLTAWSLRARHFARQRQATEAQLHLLQAQIEPQFLFNTLADVQGLLDNDPDGARQMLEEFTDYLRASLGQLRRADSTLAAELDMAQCYLQLLRLKMGDRLRFSIDASSQARSAKMPPLLLQPLVENAIRHGIAPTKHGGCIRIHAEVRLGRLHITVSDDGMGLPAAHAGNGLALGNIRARLQARYGVNAALTLVDSTPGACALINLPFVGAAVDWSHIT